MRILLINANGGDSTRGGAERYVGDLAAALQGRGEDVQLLSAFPVQDATAELTHTLHGEDWRDSRRRRYLNHLTDWIARPSPRLEECLREIAPDLVHTNNLPGISTGVWECARRLGLPAVHTLHDYHLLCPRTSLTRRDGSPCDPSPLLCGYRTRRLARWSGDVRLVIGVSEHVVQRHRGFFPPGIPTRVIHHPIHPSSVAAAPPAAESPKTMGFIGLLSQTKGIDLLLQAAPLLRRLGVQLRIAGDGPLRAAVEATPDVDYAGYVRGAELAGFRSACDVGVVPSLWEEPAGLVVPEWLAAGRPVLSTGSGGLAEAAELGGVVAFEPSVAGLVGAVRQLRDPARWREVLAAVPRVGDERDVERWVDQHQAAYRAALTSTEAVPR